MNEISQFSGMVLPSVDSIAIHNTNSHEREMPTPNNVNAEGISMVKSGIARYGASYSQILHSSLNTVNHNQHYASSQMAAVTERRSDDLIGTVMAIQNASMSFQFLLQARNRFVEGYHELFNQQV